MNNLNHLDSFRHIHFIGIGGISMSALAKHALQLGIMVSGSDKQRSEITDELKKLGAKIYYRHSTFNLKKPDLVVYTSAVSAANKELKKARFDKIPTMKRSEFLNLIMKSAKTRIAISGSHGKTTATAMLANILIDARLDPTVFLGGEDEKFSNYRKGSFDLFVTEACEYKKNLLDLNPTCSVVLNVDNDHLESYGNMQIMAETFSKFVSGSVCVLNADDKLCDTLHTGTAVTFGINKSAVYSAKYIRKKGDGYSFTVHKHEKSCVRINLPIAGKHNIYNALSAFAVSDLLGVKHALIKKSLDNFVGVKRRNEKMGQIFGIQAVADYAHHPNEITATLTALKAYKKDTLVVFQPHTYSRTKNLMQEFVNCFSNVENLIIYKTYPAREKFDSDGSAKTLFDNLINDDMNRRAYVNGIYSLKKEIKAQRNTINRIVFIGAGDIYQTAKTLVGKNKNKF